nr:NYN domain-containing protein [Salinibacterium sp. SWN1162]
MPSEGRVAVYIDFDNIVISRYNQKHGNGQFSKDKARGFSPAEANKNSIGEKLVAAEVDVEAVLDYASSFGTVAFSRAYADWSVAVNAAYQKQLVNRAVELVQLFPLTAQMKNGADIRLSVDAMEDMFRLPDITHVVIVAGDSDYVALAQRAKMLGRYVVGIGVAGGTSQALTASCDKFADYDSLPGVEFGSLPQGSGSIAGAAPTSTMAPAKKQNNATASTPKNEVAQTTTATKKSSTPLAVKEPAAVKNEISTISAVTEEKVPPFRLLIRAMRLVQQKEDSDWLNNSAVKSQMLRIDPSFSESSLKFKTYGEFVRSHHSHIEMREHNGVWQLRLRNNVALPD